MPIVVPLLVLLALVLLSGLLATLYLTGRIEAAHPPNGRFIEVDGVTLHYRDIPGASANATAVLFIHGASGNLNDALGPALATHDGNTRLIAVDRPGHGWSGRIVGQHDTPDAQARLLGRFLEALGVNRAIVVGHSFGGSVAAAFALERPDLTKGLLFLAPATHPWPGGATNWYYDVASVPVIGPLFAYTLATPGGWFRLESATDCVFSPNKVPQDYLDKTGIALVLTPRRFLANARDVSRLYPHVVENAKDYPSITAPTIIITGDSDTVVYEEIHSDGLERDIAGARKIVVPNLGHKPDHVVPELVAGAIATLDGRPADLEKLATDAAERISDDRFGPVERCPQPKLPQEAG